MTNLFGDAPPAADPAGLSASVLIGGASRDHKRSESDFYPTPPDCTVALADCLALPVSRVIWEPACGDGAISKVFAARGHSVVSTDLRPDSGYGEGSVNFLTCEPRACDFIVTNPPFNLAERFIDRCRQLDKPFAMLLKATYWHAFNRMPLFERHPPALILPLTWRPNFMPERGNAPTMDMAWSVWLRDTQHCIYQPLLRPRAANGFLNLKQIGS